MDNRAEKERLDSMTAGEIAEEMSAVWGGMSEENYEDKTIRAYLDALDEKNPMPELPGTEEALKRFRAVLTGDEPSPGKQPRLRYALHVALAAAILTALLLGGALAVQAIEYHRYGTVAHWTEEIFSFGWIGKSEATSLQPEDGNYQDVLEGILEKGKVDSLGNREYTDLQEAMDDLGIRDVHAPALPDGYALQSLWAAAEHENGGYFCLNAEYVSAAGDTVKIMGLRYSPFYSHVITRNGEPVEVKSIGGVRVYVIPTASGCAAAWVTGKYEWNVFAPDKDALLSLLSSMLEQ